MNEKVKAVLLAAASVAHDRGGDIDTEGGTYASTNVDSMIDLQSALADAFGDESDDVIYHKIAPKIKAL